MQTSRHQKVVAITGAVLAGCGFVYLFFDGGSLLSTVLILAGSGVAILAARKNPDLWKLVRRDSHADIGDWLMLAGVLTGMILVNFLELPTRHDRGLALLAPGLLLAAGIFCKVYGLFRQFGRDGVRKP